MPDPADILTFIEHRGSMLGAGVVAWVGDGNNMANTWLQAAEILGFTCTSARPVATRSIRGGGHHRHRLLLSSKDPMAACAAPTW